MYLLYNENVHDCPAGPSPMYILKEYNGGKNVNITFVLLVTAHINFNGC